MSVAAHLAIAGERWLSSRIADDDQSLSKGLWADKVSTSLVVAYKSAKPPRLLSTKAYFGNVLLERGESIRRTNETLAIL